ncbi:hypothetical protein [Bradyrhizobium sp. AC87j1]|uniref:P-loop ATPase, Sll1717 family n=1 Tax=Bradyrhizobium sp. AC87j1 TaxID=2055894 RepID=UPI0011B0D94D|nr:hypothetical protein [Bradyrhizobium sp. AC87j1]
MSQASFGPLSAERDAHLLDYFHRTAFIQNILSAPSGDGPFLILSRPGAGKTALKKWLLSKDSPYATISLDATTARVFVDDPSFNDEDYRTLLRAELLAGLLGELIGRNPAQQRKAQSKTLRDAYAEAEDFVTKNFLESVVDFVKDRFASLQILGTGFSLSKEERGRYLKQVRRKDLASAALKCLENVTAAEKHRFCLVVDNPEYIVGHGLALTDRANAFRIGALLNLLAEIHTAGLRVAAFTKFHVFDSVQEHYTDYSHFADSVARLEWTRDDLIEFVSLRVRKRLKSEWNDVFGLTQKDFADLVFPRIINGPRDVLFLLSEAQSASAGVKLSNDNLLSASTQLKDDKYKDMSRLFGGIYPGVDAFCKAAVAVVRDLKPSMTTQSVDAAIDSSISDPHGPLHGIRAKYDWVINVQAGIPRASALLGTLGAFVFVADGRRHYPWEGHPLEALDRSDSIELSPLFK